MADLRAIKTKLELDVLRYVCAISSAAHRKVMRSIKPGMSEYQVYILHFKIIPEDFVTIFFVF